MTTTYSKETIDKAIEDLRAAGYYSSKVNDRTIAPENITKALEFGEKLLKNYESEQSRAAVGAEEAEVAEQVYCLKDLLRLAIKGAKS